VTGDVTVIARIASQTNTSISAKAGLMLRASTDPGAPYIAVLMTTTKGVATQWRLTQGATTAQATKLAAVPPEYLRLVRSGSTFTASISADAVTWTQTASVSIAAIGSSALGGFAVTSHNTGALGTATFDHVSVN
jgi:hypothetical protein